MQAVVDESAAFFPFILFHVAFAFHLLDVTTKITQFWCNFPPSKPFSLFRNSENGWSGLGLGRAGSICSKLCTRPGTFNLECQQTVAYAARGCMRTHDPGPRPVSKSVNVPRTLVASASATMLGNTAHSPLRRSMSPVRVDRGAWMASRLLCIRLRFKSATRALVNQVPTWTQCRTSSAAAR